MKPTKRDFSILIGWSLRSYKPKTKLKKLLFLRFDGGCFSKTTLLRERERNKINKPCFKCLIGIEEHSINYDQTSLDELNCKIKNLLRYVRRLENRPFHIHHHCWTVYGVGGKVENFEDCTGGWSWERFGDETSKLSTNLKLIAIV